MNNYLEAISVGLMEAMTTDSSIFLMGEGVDNITGIYGITLPLCEKFGSERIIDTPLSENGLTGICIGAALDGLRPVLFHQRNDFMLLTMDQLVNNAAKINYVSAGKHHVPLTVVSFIARKPGEGVQHSQSLQVLFAHIPGLKVVMPACAADAKGSLLTAIFDDDPVIVLYHRALFDEVDDNENLTPQGIGHCRPIKVGSDITVVATSATVKDAILASVKLEDKISIELIDLRWINPWDQEAVMGSVCKTGRLLVVDTGWPSFGVSAEIVATVAEKAHGYLKSAPHRIGMKEVPAPATPYLLGNYHPTADMIKNSILELMNY